MDRQITMRAIAEDGHIIHERPLVLNKKNDILLVEFPACFDQTQTEHAFRYLHDQLASTEEHKVIGYATGIKLRVLSIK